jgi:hypothetical protein
MDLSLSIKLSPIFLPLYVFAVCVCLFGRVEGVGRAEEELSIPGIGGS